MTCRITPDCICGLDEHILTVVGEGGGGGTCNLTTGDKGDITVNTINSWSIDNGVVSYPKIQSVNTDRLLGRVSAGAGVVEEILFTDVAQQLLTQNTISSIRTFLGLGTSSTQNTNYFALAAHTHDAADIVSGVLSTARLGTGTASSSTFLNGANQWVTINTAALADGDKGDIVVSGSGATWSFDSSVVTSFARTLLDDTTAAAARATLGITDLALSTFGQSMITAANSAAGTALLDSFTSTAKGLAPASGGGTANFLRADGTWAAPTTFIGTDSVTTTTIVNDAVTNTKLAEMPANTIKGNNTAATANPLDLTVTQVTAMLNAFSTTAKGLAPASGGGTTNYLRADGTWAAPPGAAGVTDGDKGDITVSASGATWTIDNGAVTYAKMQSVSGTDKLLGRFSAGAGNVEEVTCTSFARTILDDTSPTAVHTTLDLNTYYSQVGHTHAAGDVTSGVFNTARLGTGTANTSTYLRGDGTWTTVPSSGATPAGSDTQVQVNKAGAFGADANFLWTGTNLDVGTSTNRAAVRVHGGTETSGNPTGATLYLRQTWNVGATAGSPLFQVQVTDTSSAAASYITLLSVSGSNVSYIQKDGMTFGAAGFRSNSSNASGYTFIDGTGHFWDALGEIGQRDYITAQKFSIYNKSALTSPGANYERAVLDWKSTANTFRIGTEKAGTGLARSMMLVTDGTERIEIGSSGAIQFNNAYTFPTAAGVNGQSLVSDASGNLSYQTVVSGKVTTSSATSITLAASNNGGVLKCTAASQVLITIPTGLPTDFTMRVVQDGAGGVNIAGAAGVTIKSRVGNDSAGQYAVMWITCLASNEFVLSGDLTP